MAPAPARPARRLSTVELAYQGLEAEARAARKKKPEPDAPAPETTKKIEPRKAKPARAARGARKA